MKRVDAFMIMKNIKWNKPLGRPLGIKRINLFDDKYEKAITFTLAYQLFLLFISGLILDGGQLSQFMIVAMAAFWGSVILLVLRKPWKPSKIDILYIKWGFFPILFSTPAIMHFVWHLRGVY